MSLATRMAQAGQSRRQQPIIQPRPLPAPIGGLVTAQNVGAMEPGTAIVLKNWVPTRKGVRVRGGNVKYATLDNGPVESLISYVGTSTIALFGAAGGSIYPISNVVDPNVPPLPTVTGQTSNYYSYVNYPVTGGNYLIAVNGTDDAQSYDGTSWMALNALSTPAITGVATSSLVHVNSYRNRLYFVEAGSLRVWYLPVDSIGGAALALSLSGIFRKGGSILFTATWSSESGANSMEAYLCVYSTEGEVAVFAGDFPGASNWALVNSYESSKPLGKNASMRAGGDVAVATEQGIIPTSSIRNKDPAALALDALSRNIEPTWQEAVNTRRTVPWELLKFDEGDLFLVNTPVTFDGQSTLTIVGNLKTGAIATFEGWDNRCFAVYNRNLYFGANDGTVRIADVGGTDNGMPYTAQGAFAWDHLGSPGFTKAMKQASARFLADKPFACRLSASVDYKQQFPIPPNALPDTEPDSLWNTGEWDEAKWDAGTSLFIATTRQRSIGRTGEVFSMELQVPVNSINTPRIELVTMYHTTANGSYGV